MRYTSEGHQLNISRLMVFQPLAIDRLSFSIPRWTSIVHFFEVVIMSTSSESIRVLQLLLTLDKSLSSTSFVVIVLGIQVALNDRVWIDLGDHVIGDLTYYSPHVTTSSVWLGRKHELAERLENMSSGNGDVHIIRVLQKSSNVCKKVVDALSLVRCNVTNGLVTDAKLGDGRLTLSS